MQLGRAGSISKKFMIGIKDLDYPLHSYSNTKFSMKMSPVSTASTLIAFTSSSSSLDLGSFILAHCPTSSLAPNPKTMAVPSTMVKARRASDIDLDTISAKNSQATFIHITYNPPSFIVTSTEVTLLLLSPSRETSNQPVEAGLTSRE
jgi:hypothetical protein